MSETFLCDSVKPTPTRFSILLMSWADRVFFIFRVVMGMGAGGEWATGQTCLGGTFPETKGKWLHIYPDRHNNPHNPPK